MNFQMRRVIVNSTPIILLSNANCLEILKEVYGQIVIPQSVYDEVIQKEDSACFNLINKPDWIIVENVKDTTSKKMYQSKLHSGEVEVMMLAQEEPKADLLILDDNAAKKTAKYLGLTVTGTLGVLLKAKSLGIISSVKNIIDKIIENGFYITEEIYSLVLSQAGE